jgi:futalosine hydrolase
MQKKILITAATAAEINPILQLIRNISPVPEVPDFLISGVGLTATAYRLTRQLHLKKYDVVIQAGVAGCFDKRLSLGDVVAIRQDTLADQSVIEMKTLKTLFELNLVPNNQPPFKNGWLRNPHNDLLKKCRIPVVKGISVNQITTSKNMINFYRKTFNPVTESMEGAALHYVCLMEQVPFLQIRSISNYIGERNKKNWDMKSAIVNLNACVFSLINTLNE